MFDMNKQNLSLNQNLQLKAQGKKLVGPERASQEGIQKAVRSGRRLLQSSDRKVVMTHLTAVINAPPLHVRQSSQESIASSSLSYSLNSPKEEFGMVHKATTTNQIALRPIKVKAPSQMKTEESPEMLKLPVKSAGIRNAAFFFKKPKRVVSKKRKIIQISGKIESCQSKERTAETREGSLSKTKLKPAGRKKSSVRLAKKVKKSKTPEIETEPTIIADDLSYNFDSDLMRLNSEIDLNSHKAEVERKSEKTLSLTASPIPNQEETKQEAVPLISQSTFAKIREKRQQEADNASNPQSAKGMEFPRRFEQRLLTVDYENQNLDILSLIPEQRCHSGNTSGRSPARSYEKRSPRQDGSLGSKMQKMSSSDSNSSKLISKRLGKNTKTRNSLSSFPSQVTQKGLIQTPQGSDNGLYSDSSSKKRKPGKRISCQSLINSRTGTFTEDSQLFAYSSGSDADNESRTPALIPRKEVKKEVEAPVRKVKEPPIPPPMKKELYPPLKKATKMKSWNLLEVHKNEEMEVKDPQNLSSRMLKAFNEFRAKEPSLKSCPTVKRTSTMIL